MMARENVTMIIRQQPLRAQVVQENNPKNRKPIDPPPIIELKYNDRDDPSNAQWLVSPRTFMMVTLMSARDGDEQMSGKYLIGQTVSSLHRLKDINNKDGGFFVFGDISARKLGSYRLRFSLFDTNKDTEEVSFLGAIDSDTFPVQPQRDFGSMSESTHLTRTFSDQGVKLRVRKDNRAISGVGSKRSFNASPPVTSSPTMHSGLYGGAVQDQHYSTSASSPAAKRQRAGSEYDAASAQIYQNLPADTPISSYGPPLPTTTRWSGSDQQRYPTNYSQHSPVGMPVMTRNPSMTVQTPGWSGGYQQSSALPSPTPSASNAQTQPYPVTTSQQQASSIFGDPGAASSLPRNYYASNPYPYGSLPQQGQYSGHGSNDVHPSYSDITSLTGSVSDAAGMTPSQTQGYSQAYIETSGPYSSTEAPEVGNPYGYDQRY